MLLLARLEGNPKSGAIFVYLFISATHTAGFYLALYRMLEGLEARSLRYGESVIREGRAFNEIINYHLNFVGVGVGLFAISYET